MVTRRTLASAALAFTLSSGMLVPRAEAGDLVAFVSEGRPGEAWDHGYGAALSFGVFRLLVLEGEAARMPGASLSPDVERDMTSFTGSALLTLPAGVLRPYGGLGIGLFRETAGPVSETGVLRAWVVGLKLTLG